MISEFELIKRFQRKLPPLPKKRWPVAIGDDTSVLKLKDQHYQLLTHDLLLEKVHFLTESLQDFKDLGWKALAVNLSDIAAMGGLPQEAVVGLGIPKPAELKELDAFYGGLKACSKKFHCPIVGGDTNRSKQGWVVSVSVTGYSPRLPLLRSGAQVGDSLWVTGSLGGAALGWQLRQKGKTSQKFTKFLLQHARPQPRLLWGQALGETGWVTAMMDISDGLAGDLPHLAAASKVGFEVELEKIPRPKDFEPLARQLRKTPEDLLLGGGEDYELLFTLQSGREAQFRQWVKSKTLRVTCIGRVVSGQKVKFRKAGIPIRKKINGFQHF